MNMRAMRESPFQNLSIRKPVTDRDLERFQIRAHGVAGYGCLGSAGFGSAAAGLAGPALPWAARARSA